MSNKFQCPKCLRQFETFQDATFCYDGHRYGASLQEIRAERAASEDKERKQARAAVNEAGKKL